MKIKPEIFLLNYKKNLYKKILISGSDITFIDYLTSFLVRKFKDEGYFIDDSEEMNGNSAGDLFSNKKKLYLLKNPNSKKINVNIPNAEDSLVISSKNNKTINGLKNKYAKDDSCLLLECYPLNKSNKELVIKKYFESLNNKINQNVFWYMIENFEDDYVFLKKQLNTLSFLQNKTISIKDIECAVNIENKINIDKIFFYIFYKNDFLIKLYNKNIFSLSEFYALINSLKFYINIISSSKNIEEALVKFPRYLFNEKEIFIRIYKCFNEKKLIQIYKNILKAEITVRKSPKLYSVVGLRFFLNSKKIIVS